MTTQPERDYLADKVEVSKVPTIAPGPYVGTLAGVTKETHEQYGVRWVWHWVIPGVHPDDGGDFDLQVWTPPRITSDKGKAGDMARALGATVGTGQTVDLNALRGKRALLSVGMDETGTRNRLAGIMPALDATAAAAVDPEYAEYLAKKAAAQAAAPADEPPLPEPPADVAA